MKLTKKQLVEELALSNRLGSNAAASEVLEHLLSIISDSVASGKEVYLGETFGGFKPATQAPRSGKVLGTAYSTPEKRVIKFQPSAALKEKIAV